jgi:hypothetical protein
MRGAPLSREARSGYAAHMEWRGPSRRVHASTLVAALALAGCGGDEPARETDASSSGVGASGAGGASGGNGSGGDAVGGDGGARADGSVGPWTELAAMPEPRANHCSGVVAGFLVVVGGNYKPDGSADFVKTAAVHAARIEADGSLGSWQLAGEAPSAVSECTLASSDDALVLVDGLFDGAGDEGQVWSASLSNDGALGAWTALGPAPAGQRLLATEAWIRDGALLAVGTQLPDAGDTTLLYRAALGETLAAWSSSTLLAGFRAQGQYALGDGFVWALGGYLDSEAMNEMVDLVDAAPLLADGAVGAALAGQPLPAPTGFGEAAAVDGFLFVVGGKEAIFAGAASAEVISAPIGADGTPGPWTAQTPLPEGRSNHDLVPAGDFLYVTGGGFDGPGLANVWSARVRFD